MARDWFVHSFYIFPEGMIHRQDIYDIKCYKSLFLGFIGGSDSELQTSSQR